MNDISADQVDALDLGMLVGQNQTFGLLSGRCSAAFAATLCRLRQEEKYKSLNPRWRDFCSQYLRLSGAEADRIIHCWEEFGPAYFDLTQLVRISPKVYRQIAPAIRDGALQMAGEAIGLNVDNARRLTAAVAELRRAAPNPPKKKRRPRAPHEQIEDLDKRCTALIAEFREISSREQEGENWLQFTAVLTRVTRELRRLELENGIV